MDFKVHVIEPARAIIIRVLAAYLGMQFATRETVGYGTFDSKRVGLGEKPRDKRDGGLLAVPCILHAIQHWSIQVGHCRINIEHTPSTETQDRWR